MQINQKSDKGLKLIIYETLVCAIPYINSEFVNILKYALRTIKKGALYQ